jgi:uncharacterized protein
MMLLDQKALRFAIKATSQRTFTGLASTWDLDEGGDLILPGAYKATLQEWQQSGRVIPLINQHNYHDARHAVGKMVGAKETTEGLESTFQLVNSPEGDEFLARIKDGIIDGLSIGYSVRQSREPSEAERKLGIHRVIEDIELREVSLVIWGMNPNALIDTASVKSLAATLASLKREALTDDQRKDVRQIASLCGALLRKSDPSPADDEQAADTDEDKPADDAPPPPETPPGGEPADAEKANTIAAEALAHRIRRLRLDRTIHDARSTLTHGGTR